MLVIRSYLSVLNDKICHVTPIAMNIRRILIQMFSVKKNALASIVVHNMATEDILALKGIALFSLKLRM